MQARRPAAWRPSRCRLGVRGADCPCHGHRRDLPSTALREPSAYASPAPLRMWSASRERLGPQSLACFLRPLTNASSWFYLCFILSSFLHCPASVRDVWLARCVPHLSFLSPSWKLPWCLPPHAILTPDHVCRQAIKAPPPASVHSLSESRTCRRSLPAAAPHASVHTPRAQPFAAFSTIRR